MPDPNKCNRIADPAARQRCLNYEGEFAEPAGPPNAGSSPFEPINPRPAPPNPRSGSGGRGGGRGRRRGPGGGGWGQY